MKKNCLLHRIISFLLAAALLVGWIPAAAFAAEDGYSCDDYYDCTADGGDIYVVVKSGAPIRKEAHNKGEIYARAEEGQLLAVKRIFWNAKRLSRWCEIVTDNGPLYIHVDNCEPHVHNYVTLVKNEGGSIECCLTCGVAKAIADGEVAKCDLTCVLDQSVKGSFSDYNPSFAGILGQMIASELMGPIADGRDLVGDLMKGEPAWVIGMDLMAFLPLVGLLRYADEVSILGRTTKKVAKNGKHLDELAFGGKSLEQFASMTGKTDSTKLGKNMRKAFDKTGKDRFYDLSDFMFDGKGNVAAHHIIAGGDNNKYARDCRGLLAFVGIDVNDAENGVFLIQKAKYADDAAVHIGRHSEEYYKKVYDILDDAVKDVKIPDNADDDMVISLYREVVVAALDDIAEGLMTGDIKLN